MFRFVLPSGAGRAGGGGGGGGKGWTGDTIFRGSAGGTEMLTMVPMVRCGCGCVPIGNGNDNAVPVVEAHVGSSLMYVF